MCSDVILTEQEQSRAIRSGVISSRTPSTRLGHPSASVESRTWLVSHPSVTNGSSNRIHVLPKFANACGLRDHHGGSRYDLLATRPSPGTPASLPQQPRDGKRRCAQTEPAEADLPTVQSFRTDPP